MAGTAKQNPIDELPPGEFIQAVFDRLDHYKAHPIAKLALTYAREANRCFVKDIKLVIDAASDAEGSAAPVLDVGQLTANVRSDTQALAKRLKRVRMGTQVEAAQKAHANVSDLAQALVLMARGNADAIVKGQASELKGELDKLLEAQSRANAGGHAAFPAKVSDAATRCWVSLDIATHLYAALLLDKKLVDDPVLASAPTVKSVMRPVLLAPKSVTRAKKGKKKAAGGKKADPKKAADPAAKAPVDGAKPKA